MREVWQEGRLVTETLCGKKPTNDDSGDQSLRGMFREENEEIRMMMMMMMKEER